MFCEGAKEEVTRMKIRTLLFHLALLASPLLAAQIAFAAGATVAVDYSKPKQTLSGFGAAVTWVANDLQFFSPASQTAILDALYNTNMPSAGLSWVRVGTMLCQFNPSSGTYNFNDPLIQSEVSWVNRVKSTYGVNNVLASTWTPPAWMKSNGSCSNGGSLLPQYYPDFSNTVVSWLQDWKAAVGTEVAVESLQNEPTNNTSYDSCIYTTDQINTVSSGYLVPAMRSAGLTSKYTSA
jgi:glucuronoarabinoxylan endo-1,4-beta-xylanase